MNTVLIQQRAGTPSEAEVPSRHRSCSAKKTCHLKALLEVSHTLSEAHLPCLGNLGFNSFPPRLSQTQGGCGAGHKDIKSWIKRKHSCSVQLQDLRNLLTDGLWSPCMNVLLENLPVFELAVIEAEHSVLHQPQSPLTLGTALFSDNLTAHLWN